MRSLRQIRRCSPHSAASSITRPLSSAPSSAFISWVNDFNHIVASHPRLTLVAFLATRNACFYGLVGAYMLSPLTLSPALGVGFRLAKFSGKLRQPANIAIAALLSRIFPSLKSIKSAALLGILPAESAAAASPLKPGAINTHDSRIDNNVTERPKNDSETANKWKGYFETLVVGPVDTYGFSLFLASKVTISAAVVAGAACAHAGMDTSALLSYLGVSETLQAGGAAMGAALLTNNVLLTPFQMYSLPPLTRAIAYRYDWFYGLIQ